MAQIIDGKAVAAKVREEVRGRAEAFARQHGRKPGLSVVLVGDDPASHVYVRNKETAAAGASIEGAVHRLPAATSQSDLLALVHQLNRDDKVDGILVQLPVPAHIDPLAVVDALDPDKDVDGLHPMNAGRLAIGRDGLRPCTPFGCMRLLAEIGCDPKGKHAVVVGRSNLVGKPVAQMLLEKHATVTIAHSRTPDLVSICRQADILVAAVGKVGLIGREHVKEGAVVLDVGMNRGADGKLCGDVSYAEVLDRAGWITPVPGGVGPMTIAMLLSNTLDAATRRELSR